MTFSSALVGKRDKADEECGDTSSGSNNNNEQRAKDKDKDVAAAGRNSSVQRPQNQVQKPRRLSMESGPVGCDLCGKVYKNRSTLYSHKNRDHGVKASSSSSSQQQQTSKTNA